jgi:hypothetical protein
LGQIVLAVAFLAVVFVARHGTTSGIGGFESALFDSWFLLLGAF